MRFYIDPGTGSMLFTVLVGLLGACIYGLRNLIIKIRFVFSGGQTKKIKLEKMPIVIYSDDKRYWNLFGPICRELEARKEKTVFMTSSPDDPALKEKFDYVECKFIGEGNKGYAKLNMLSANVLLATTPGLDVYQWRKSKDVDYYIHILHMVSDPTLYRLYGLDYYDAVLLSGKYQIRQIRDLEKMRKLKPKELKIVGQPYMDELLKRANKEKNNKQSSICVLLAPSWGPSSILNRYGEDMINQLIETGYHVIVRPHPQSFKSEKDLINKLMSSYPNIEWNLDNDNFDVLNRADIMISDFSGVMFDFALVFGKPVIYADISFDKSPYDAYWDKNDLWTFEALNKIGTKLPSNNNVNIKEVIDNCLNDNNFQNKINQLRQEAWEHIGDSAKLTVDFLIEKKNEILEKEDAKHVA